MSNFSPSFEEYLRSSRNEDAATEASSTPLQLKERVFTSNYLAVIGSGISCLTLHYFDKLIMSDYYTTPQTVALGVAGSLAARVATNYIRPRHASQSGESVELPAAENLSLNVPLPSQGEQDRVPPEAWAPQTGR